MVPAPAGMSPDAPSAPDAMSRGPRTCGDEPTVLPSVPLFGAAAEDRASLRQRVVEKLQTLFDRF